MSPLALFAAAGTGVQVGAVLVASRLVLDDIGPGGLALLRYAIGAACIAPFLLSAGHGLPRWRDLPALTLLGICQFAGVVGLLNLALLHAPPGRVSLLFASMSVLTMALAALIDRKRPSRGVVLGLLASLAGVALTIGEGALRPGVGVIGEALALAAACCGATTSVLCRPYLARYPALPVGFLCMAASVLALLPWALNEGVTDRLAPLTGLDWALILGIGASSGLFYVLWLWAIARTPVGKVAAFLALGPPTAALLGFAFLGQGLTPVTIVGIVLVCLGLLLATRGS